MGKRRLAEAGHETTNREAIVTEDQGTGGPTEVGPEDERLVEATRLADDERWEEAYELLLELEHDFPEDATLLCMLGVVAGEASASGLAYDYFRRSLAAQPSDPNVLVALGTGLAYYDDPDAEGVLRLAAITAPSLAAARLHYGAYLAREGIFDLALAELRAAQELDPDDPQVERELGAAFILSGGLQDGVTHLERAAALGIDNPGAHVLYGLALIQARQVEEGAEELVRAAMELPDEADVQIAAALAAATQGWLDEAWNALARAESARSPADSTLLREVEDVLEQDEEAAEVLLLEQILSPLLHSRLLDRG